MSVHLHGCSGRSLAERSVRAAPKARKLKEKVNESEVSKCEGGREEESVATVG